LLLLDAAWSPEIENVGCKIRSQIN